MRHMRIRTTDGDLPHRERANILDKMVALKTLRLKVRAPM